MRPEAPDALQRERIDVELGIDLLVAAGAGSGKTSKLVDRYVALLRDGCEPDEIVVVTFTRKAAGEMKERLRSKLAQLGEETGDSVWLRRRRAIEDAPIETMDAFCLRLLRSEAIVAGLDPGFEILDLVEQETLPLQVAAEVFRAALRAGRDEAETLLAETGDFPSAVTAVAAVLGQRKLWRDPFRPPARESLAERTLSYLAAEDDGAGPPTAAELAAAFGAERERRVQQLMAELANDLLPALTAIWDQLPADPDPTDKFTPTWRLARRVAQMDPAVPDLDLLAEFRATNLSGGKAAVWGGLLKEAKAFITGQFRPWYDKSLKPMLAGGPEQDAAVARATAAALPLVKATERELEELKRRLGKLGFEDLLLRAAQLLASEAGREVLARVRQRYRRVLVDEYQDSSGLQDRLFRRIAGDRAGAFFAVGDDKQSIYGFRDADLTVFNRARDVAGAGLVPLTATFRLAPTLAATLNEAFSAAETMGREAHEADDAAVFAPLEAVERPDRTLLPGPEVRWLIHVGDNVSDARAREAAAIAADIRRQVVDEQPLLSEWLNVASGPDPRPLRYGDIAILMKTTGGIELYRNALGALGIPVRTERGRLSRRQEVGDLLAAGRWLLSPRHGLATVALLRSPLVGLSDAAMFLATPDRTRLADTVEAQVEGLLREQPLPAPAGLRDSDRGAWRAAMERLCSWRVWAAEMPIGQVLRKVVEQTGYRAVLAALADPDRRLANLEKLLDGLAALEAAGMSSEQALAVYETRQAEGSKEDAEGAVFDADADAVSLMSVHGAKGLERPVVYVADLAHLPRRPDKPVVVVWRHLPVVAGGAASEQGVALPGALIAEAAPRGPVLEFEEERLLYVACTRARDRLILSSALCRTADGGHKQASKTWHEALACATGFVAPDSVTMAGIQVEVMDFEPVRPADDIAERLTALDALAALPADPHGVKLPVTLPEATRMRSVASLARAAGEGVEDGEVSRAEVVEAAIVGAERGTMVHELLRIAAHRRGPLTAEDVRTAAAGQGRRLNPETDAATIDHLLAVAGRALACDVVRRALAMAEVMIETPFIRHDGESLVSGRVDLVGLDPDRVLLVDYKTGSLSQRLRAQYAAEVGEYRAALEQQYPGRAIEVVLPFLDLPGRDDNVRCLELRDGQLEDVEP